MGSEAKEALGKFTVSTSTGDATEKGEHKMVREAQCWFSDLQVLEKLTRDNDTKLQPVCTLKYHWLVID